MLAPHGIAVLTVKGMNKTPAVDPPEGYTLFAVHAANGWALWVPPISQGTEICLQKYQFINTNGMVGKYGPSPCASAGPATQDPKKPYLVSTFDVQNDFSPHGLQPTQPYIPQFIAMWCTYVIAIAPHFEWTEIAIDDVVSPGLRALLASLGFQGDAMENYLGVMTTIAPNTRARCTASGWAFAATSAFPEQEVGGVRAAAHQG
jgi:hypothetical protein